MTLPRVWHDERCGTGTCAACKRMRKTPTEPWTVNIEKLSGRSYRTMLRVGVQGFELASGDDPEALDRCRFIQKKFVHAMKALGAPKPRSAKIVPNPERVIGKRHGRRP